MEKYYLDFYISEQLPDLENLPLVNILNNLFLLFCFLDDLLTFSNEILLQLDPSNFTITDDSKEGKSQIHKLSGLLIT